MVANKLLIVVIGAILSAGALPAQPALFVEKEPMQKAVPFTLKEVRLLNSPFRNAMDKDAAWLLRLEPDRFLHRFHQNAGLPTKGKIYGGWESRGVSGHSLGHYLSACAMMYAASGDVRFKQKTDYIIAELARCQQARKTGYVGGIPNEDSIWDEVAAGNIQSQGFDLNGGWVPWYTVHKVLAGLIDVYSYTGNNGAKIVATGLCDWIDTKFKNLSETQFQKMLDCEQGGMNESLAEMYALTKDKKYLALSQRFDHQKILDPLAAGRDVLPGLHANTQIPKVIGRARRYELTGKPADYATSQFFWNTVVNDYSYVIGGNSDHERFSPTPGHLSEHLSTNSTETCNSYNMLKLTDHLFRLDPKALYMDYYERVLYNHILASQNPEDGMVLYYLPLASGTEKKFGTPEESFWCCTGTGMENHAKYGQNIYYKDAKEGLYVNLFIPSVISWKEKGLTLQMDTRYPEDKIINLTFNQVAAKGVQMPLYIRYPWWAKNGVQATVNGKPLPVSGTPGSYMTVNRKWQKGDKLQFSFPMSIYTESMPDNANQKAFLYGPLVLAGELGNGTVRKSDIPVFVNTGNNMNDIIKPVAGGEANVFRAVANDTTVSLKPLYKVYNQKQAVYWDFFSPAEWKVKQQEFESVRKAEEELNARTLDIFRVGEMQPERDHNFEGERTNTGEVDGLRWRDAVNGGWFSFTLDTKGATAAQLQCIYWGSDGGNREFDILVDGQKIATEKLVPKQKPGTYNVLYAVPENLLSGKQKVVIRFQALPGKTAGGVFGCRLIKSKQIK